MKVMIRGYVGKTVLFEDPFDMPEADEADDELEKLMPALAEKHGRSLADHSLHMIEIEFLDEPDPNQRFFRFGTDPSGMVWPVALKL